MRGELVGNHALHVGLDDGFGAEQAGAEKGLVGRWDFVYQVVVQQRVGGKVVPTCGLLAVEEERVALVEILVDAVVVVYGPGLVGGCVEQVGAVGYVGFVVAQQTESQCGIRLPAVGTASSCKITSMA